MFQNCKNIKNHNLISLPSTLKFRKVRGRYFKIKFLVRSKQIKNMVDKKTIIGVRLRIILAISIIYYPVQLLSLRKNTSSAIPLWWPKIIRTGIYLKKLFKIFPTYTFVGIQNVKYTVHVRNRVSYKMYILESFCWVTFVLISMLQN